MTRRSVDVRIEDLLRSACAVIAERGLANTRTADVASAAGVSQALLFYHFGTKERLLARAFEYAAEQDLTRLEAALRSTASPLDKLRRVLRLRLPAGGAGAGARAGSWRLWIDSWSESLRSAELERVTRRVDGRWREALAAVVADGRDHGAFKCDDPTGAALRIAALTDGLAVQLTVHPRSASRREAVDWIRQWAARELGIDADQLA